MKRLILSAAMAFALASGFAQQAEKTTLGITKITAGQSLQAKMKADGKTQTLSRVLESLDSNLTAAIQATRKFELVSRSDLDAVSKEIAFAESGNVADDKNAAKSGMLKGAKYILVVSVDDF